MSDFSPGPVARRAEIDRIFLRTSGWGFLRTLLAVPVYLVLTPFVVHKVGKEMYGLWSINGIVTTALMLVDFGFQNSLVHFTASNLSERGKLGEMFNTVFFFFLVASLTCLCLALGLRGILIHDFLKIPMEIHSEAVFVFMSTVAGFCLRLLSMPYQGIIEGHHRVDYTQKVYIIWLIFNAIATFIGLSIWPSVYSLGITSLIGNFILWGMFFIEAKKQYSCVKVSLMLFKLSTIRLMFPYSVWIQVASVFILVREPILKTVVIRNHGLDDLASLEIAYRLTIQCMSFVIVPLLTTLPVASMLRNQNEEIKRMVRKYFLWVVVFLAIPAVVIYPASGFALRLWLGAGFEDAALLLPWIFTAYALYYLTEPIYKTLQGMGLSWASAFVQGLYILTLAGGLFFWSDSQDLRSVAYPLLLASAVFSAANVLVYSLRMPAEAAL